MDLPNIATDRVRALIMERCAGWDENRFATALMEYRKFLELCRLHPNACIMAPSDVDEIWHMHMLDSIYYTADCNRIFGAYLHHDPCIGPADPSKTRRTLELFEAAFGTTPVGDWLQMMTCARPGGGCGSIRAN